MLLELASGLAVTATVLNAVPTIGNAVSDASGTAEAAAVLPSGSSATFRERMLDWDASAEEAPLRLTEQADRPAPRLDRLELTSRFGWRADPITGKLRRHAGIDLPSHYGSPVMATGPGVVRFAGWAGGYGNMVEIEHSGGVRTLYGHLSRLDVRPFQNVETGEIIGEVGSTGHTTGPHLHYEIRVGRFAVDPLTFAGQRTPAYETVWAPELHAKMKWTGWTRGLHDTLPEASLR